MTLDPRVKILLSIALSTMAIVFDRLVFIALLLLLAFMLAKLMGGRILLVFKRLKAILILFLMISLLQSIFNGGAHPIWTVGSVTILTREGMMSGVILFSRMIILLLSGIIIATSGSRAAIVGLVQMKVPYEIAFMTCIALLFLPRLKQEAQNSLMAIELRGVEVKKMTFQKKIKLYSYLILPVITRCILTARSMALSMEMLAFRAYPKRTSYLVLVMRWYDYAVLSLAGLVTAGALVFYFFGGAWF